MMTLEDFRAAFLDLGIVRQAMPILWMGLQQTLLLSLLVVPLGLLAGLALALLSRAESRWVRWPLAAWVDLFRALPPLVLLVLVYAGLPFAGLEVSAWAAVAIAFLLNTGAYFGEVLRAGLDSVPRGQSEAARALGLRPWQGMALVVLPQAARNVLPDLLGNVLEVVKLTSIASVVALPELLFQARQAQSVTYNASPIVAAAVAYFLLLWPLVRVLSRLENRRAGAR
ncbi:amino acid ABC transporter permease [Roseomonas sp. OT10]|uniref:amino acid ABC transporter permease n=1 Tax=Roseomonas cutis TaxID=2897332 RepID=UPI001E509187|nr:amino acid ABC transporter permease [Roseomonas sp. OT10]UFN49882.1 amino acid ABC transporter permease [Roseomonas sp. OT10]